VIYTSQSDGNYDNEYLKLSSANPDLMSDDLFDKLHDIIFKKVSVL